MLNNGWSGVFLDTPSNIHWHFRATSLSRKSTILTCHLEAAFNETKWRCRLFLRSHKQFSTTLLFRSRFCCSRLFAFIVPGGFLFVKLILKRWHERQQTNEKCVWGERRQASNVTLNIQFWGRGFVRLPLIN